MTPNSLRALSCAPPLAGLVFFLAVTPGCTPNPDLDSAKADGLASVDLTDAQLVAGGPAGEFGGPGIPRRIQSMSSLP